MGLWSRGACLVAFAAGTACFAGCGSEGEQNAVKPSTSATSVGRTSTSIESAAAGPSTSLDLTLEDGASEAVASFQAGDPRVAAQTVTLILSRPAPDLTVDFTTTGGSTLHLLRANSHNDSCTSVLEHVECTIEFPRLEAQLPGQWTATASKNAGPPVEVSLTIEWHAFT